MLRFEDYSIIFDNSLWKRLSAGTVPVNKKHLTGTVPANKEHLTGTVPVNKEHLTGTLSNFWGIERKC